MIFLMMEKGLPEYIYEMPLFMYMFRVNIDRNYQDPGLFAIWFIKSEKGNPVSEIVYRIRKEWWKTENKIPYALIHYALRLVYCLNYI